jgi:hypothetical protein
MDSSCPGFQRRTAFLPIGKGFLLSWLSEADCFPTGRREILLALVFRGGPVPHQQENDSCCLGCQRRAAFLPVGKGFLLSWLSGADRSPISRKGIPLVLASRGGPFSYRSERDSSCPGFQRRAAFLTARKGFLLSWLSEADCSPTGRKDIALVLAFRGGLLSYRQETDSSCPSFQRRTAFLQVGKGFLLSWPQRRTVFLPVGKGFLLSLLSKADCFPTGRKGIPLALASRGGLLTYQ